MVSIIVAVYKAEEYIQKCIDSIQAQTYTDFEAILVDDGSPDNSGKICDRYAVKDSRFKVIHQSNGGVSAARQTGLDSAQGEYVIHVDPDDWIEPNMLEELVAKIEAEDADMVFCDFWEEDKLKTKYISQNLNCKYGSKEIINQLLSGKLYGSCWNKLYKKSCLDGIRFQPNTLVVAEDLLFNVRVLCNDIKITYLPKAYYHYLVSQTQSLVGSASVEKFYSWMTIVSELEVIREKNSMVDDESIRSKKISALCDAFLAKRFDLMQSSFTEVHTLLVQQGKPYRWYNPLISCLSIALCGYPRSAYFIYKIHVSLIDLLKNIKHKL